MASKNVVEFTSENWQAEVAQSAQPVLVDFWAPWCGPCRQLSPTIDKIADQFAGKVKVGKVNVDENSDLAIKYDVTTIPRVLMFKGSDKPVHQIVGLTPEAELVKLLNGALSA
ncbi:MAG TPA: thioredoxin [Gemmataceae bacterium]|jgi:thioredoxin 1|nr:thioredoxin [Gemmataceae bacterium]